MATKGRTPIRAETFRITWAPEEGRNVASYVALLGRILFGGYFAFAGVNHILQFGALTQMAAGQGFPFPALGVAASVPLLLVGGLSIILGFRPHLLAWWPILFLLPAAFTMHTFWAVPDPQAAQEQMSAFLRNLAFTGALLMIATIRHWPLSLDWRGSERKPRPD